MAKLFSRIVRVTKLKPGTYMDSGLMYCLYQNQGQGLISLGVKSPDRFYNLLLMKKKIITDFSGTMKAIKLKFGVHLDSGLFIMYTRSQGPITLGVTPLDRFYNFPLMTKNCRTFLKNCKCNEKLKPGTHMDRELMFMYTRVRTKEP